MRYQALLLCSLLFVTGCAGTVFGKKTRALRVIGVVEEPRSDALRIRIRGGDVKEVRTDERTFYTKWLTQQPWTVDKMVTAKSVTIGRCVNVLLRADDLRLAARVEVSLDKAGALRDPCKTLR